MLAPRFYPLLMLAMTSPLALACSGTTEVDSGRDAGGADVSNGSPDAATSDADTCAPPTPGAWAITESGLSRACTTHTDCQAVYLGDDACEVARVDGVQNFPCPNAAISQSSYMSNYLPRYEAISRACHAVCGAGSILCAGTPVYCNAGSCDVHPPSDGGVDAGGIPLGGLCDPLDNQCAGGLRCCYTSRPVTGAKPVCASAEAACNPP